MVHVTVGPDKKAFAFHKNLLCNSAPFFRAALDGNFKEAQKQSIEMPEDDPEVFNYFQLWLYTGSILEEHETATDVEDLMLAKIWISAEALNISELQNVAMNLLIDRADIRLKIPTNCAPYIYEHTSEGSALRRFIVEKIAHNGILSKDSMFFEAANRSLYPDDFLYDLIMKLYLLKSGKTRSEFERSEYQVKAVIDPTKSGTN